MFQSRDRGTTSSIGDKVGLCSAVDPSVSEEEVPLTVGEILVKDIASEIRQEVRKYTKVNQLGLIGIAAAKKKPEVIPTISGAHDEMGAISSYSDGTDDGLTAIHDDVETYSEWVGKTCMEDGIDYIMKKIPIPTTTANNQYGTDDNNIKDRMAEIEVICKRIKDAIQSANESPGSYGVLVFYPILNRPLLLGNQTHQLKGIVGSNISSHGLDYKTLDDHLREQVCFKRDVEGLSPLYHTRQNFRNPDIYIDRSIPSIVERSGQYHNHSQDKMIFPCTALAVLRILQKSLEKKAFDPCKPLGRRFDTVVTIINRSEIVGRPLASMLASDGCTVYSVDDKSVILYSPRGRMKRLHLRRNCEDCISGVPAFREAIQNSKVIVTAVPSATFKVPSDWIQPDSIVVNVASEPNVHEDDLIRNVDGVLYIPQVGKVVCSLLEQNLVTLHQRYHRQDIR